MARSTRIGQAFTLLSALTFALLTLLWIRSYRYANYARVNDGDVPFGLGGVMVDQGRVVFLRHLDPRWTPHDRPLPQVEVRWFRIPSGEPPSWAWLFNSGPDTFRAEAAGFLVQADSRIWLATVPCWFAAAVFAIPSALWLRRSIASRRNRGLHHCSDCGYDLRATPDRCPECGVTNTRDRSRLRNGLRHSSCGQPSVPIR